MLCFTQKVGLFGNIFPPSNSLGTWAVCIKILEKKFKGVLGNCASEIKNWPFSTKLTLL